MGHFPPEALHDMQPVLNTSFIFLTGQKQKSYILCSFLQLYQEQSLPSYKPGALLDSFLSLLSLY